MEIPAIAFNAAQLLRDAPGASRRHELAATGALRGGRVELVRIGAGALVRASLEVALELECARCLAPVVAVAPVAFDEIYEQRHDVVSGARLDADDADPDAFAITRNHVIDITEAVRQYCEAAAPMQPLCSDGCRGLCPQCGAERSAGECACAPTSGDPRWAALAALERSEP